MQGVTCHGIPASCSLAAGDSVGSHGKASGSHVTSEGGEGGVSNAPVTVAIGAAVGAHVGIVCGALGETFNSSRVGGHIDDGGGDQCLSIIGVEVAASLVGNLPSVLTFRAIGPFQNGGVSCTRTGCFEHKGRGLAASGNLLNNEIIHIGGTAVCAFTTQDDVASAAERYRELVGVPTSGAFIQHNVAVGLVAITIEEAKFCGPFNLTIGAGIYANTFSWVGRTTCIT